MTERKDGGPAFPRSDERGLMGEGFREGSDGMALRDWFAGRAMEQLISVWPMTDGHLGDRKAVAKAAYEYADAMLAAREVKP